MTSHSLLFKKIKGDIRSTLSGLLIFLISLFCASSIHHFFARTDQVEALIVRQVDSLASNRANAQDYLSIQQELSRFGESLKGSLPYEVSVTVSLGGQLVARDGHIEDLFIPATRIEKSRVLPSGDSLVISVEIGNGRAAAEALAVLLVILFSGLVIYAILIRRLEKSFDNQSRPIEAKLDRAALHEHRAEIAEQVAHDIRSPLTALDLAIKEVNLSPDERSSLQRSVLRMNDVLNDLTQPDALGSRKRTVPAVAKPRDEYIATIVNDIITEKTHQISANKNIALKAEIESPLIQAPTVRKELTRVLSNLIDNAVEAINGSGEVKVTLCREDRFVVISIADNGIGIAKERIAELGLRGNSFGKDGGKGLGLFHAKETLNSMGGSLEISSILNVGTTVLLKFPSSTSAGLPESLTLRAKQKLVIIDDDFLIHDAWKIKTAGLGIKLLHFHSPEEFEQFANRDLIENSIFLIDYEFKGSTKTGINLICDFEFHDRAVLVSGKSNQPEIVLECDFLGIKRFPKEHIPLIPITVLTENNRMKGLNLEPNIYNQREML